jgi:5-methylcytosine-specific restriction endonuclease McrA
MTTLHSWIHDETLFTKAWLAHVNVTYPYNHLIERLNLKLRQPCLYFWTSSEPNIRQAINIAGQLLDKLPGDNYMSNPLECFIDMLTECKVTRAWLAKHLADATLLPGSALVSFVDYCLKESVRSPNKKSSLYNFEGFDLAPDPDITSGLQVDLDLGGCSINSKLFTINNVSTNNPVYADYVASVNYGLSYGRMMTCEDWLASKPQGYVFASETEIKVVTDGIAKKKPFVDNDKKVCATSAPILKFLQSRRRLESTKLAVKPSVRPPIPKSSSVTKTKIPSAVREKVWRSYMLIDDDTCSIDGSCVCCGRTITYNNWHCAHIIAEANGGPTIASNLAPTCARCNLGMKTQNLVDYRQEIIDREGWLGSKPPVRIPPVKPKAKKT